MGLQRPDNVDLNGDESVVSPRHSQPSLLGSVRGTNETKRIETDSSANLYVHVAADDTVAPTSVQPLAVGSVTNVPASTLTTVVTYTAPSDKKLTKISVSGTDYAKFQLFKNTVLIDTRRSGPERSLQFEFASPLSLASGEVLDVKVTHYATGVLADFESTIYGA